MSFNVACDLSTCGAKAHLCIVVGELVLPPGWRSFPLDDFCYHGCTDAHLQAALAENEESGTKVLKLPVVVDAARPGDQRTPSDAFPIGGR